MAELITILIDIALGALAYRLAHENRTRIAALEGRVDSNTERIAKLEEKCGQP